MNKVKIPLAALIVLVILISVFWYSQGYAPKAASIVTPKPILTPTPTSNHTANLTASLTVEEHKGFLTLDGSVANVGNNTAYNSGLQVVAYDSNRVWLDVQGCIVISATVPLAVEEGFTNPFGYFQAGNALIGFSYSVTSLSGGQTARIYLNIYHSGRVTNWTVTPVWTNTS